MRDLMDSKGQLEPEGRQDSRVLLDLGETLDLRVKLVHLDHLDPLVLTDS